MSAAATAPQCGRRVCAWCVPPRDLGHALELPAGAVTHGMCAACRQREFGAVLRPPAGPVRVADADSRAGGGRQSGPAGSR